MRENKETSRKWGFNLKKKKSFSGTEQEKGGNKGDSGVTGRRRCKTNEIIKRLFRRRRQRKCRFEETPLEGGGGQAQSGGQIA